MNRLLSAFRFTQGSTIDCHFTVSDGSIVNHDGFTVTPGSHEAKFHLGSNTSNCVFFRFGANSVTESYSCSTSDILSRCFPDLELRSSIKHLIGKKFFDLDQSQLSNYFPGIEVSEGLDGFPMFKGKNNLHVTLPQLLNKWLTCLHEASSEDHSTSEDTTAYIGIPVYFTDLQRRIVLDAANQAGFYRAVLVHETTAAAARYAMRAFLNKAVIGCVAFIDMGVTSMQICIAQLDDKGNVFFSSHASDYLLGGRAFDEVLLNHFAVKFREEHNIDVTTNSELYWELYDACEKLKVRLSTHQEDSFQIHWRNMVLTGSMRREDFEKMSDPLLEQVKGSLDKALKDVNICADDIDVVVNVGHASQIPAINKILTDIFKRKPIQTDGVAHYAPDYRNSLNIYQADIFPHPIAMSWMMGNEAGQLVAFPKQTPMNTTKEFQFSGSVSFFLNFMYDLSDSGISTVIARFKIGGPFQSNTSGKVTGKFRVRLDPNGVIHVDSAFISEGGEDVELQVSREDELQEAPEVSQQQENTHEEFLDTSTELQSITEENITKLEDKINKITRKACNESQEHEKTKKALLDTSAELQEMKSLLEIEKRKITKVKDELKKIKREASDESQQHEKTKKEILDISDELEGMRSSLEIEKEKSIELGDELHKIKREALEESQQHEKTTNELTNAMVELERQKELIFQESQRHQQAERDLQDAFLENETLKQRQNNIVKDLEKLRQSIEEQASNNNDMANSGEFTYEELKEATNDFNDNFKIGEGGYGSVYRGFIHCTSVAIKVLNEGSKQGEREFNQEVETLRKVRHPNLVTLIGACPENWALVYEFMPKGNLEDCLESNEGRKSLSWKTRIRIASNVCSALVFLHHTKPHGIVHADLKPSNILLDSSYACKLSDFGICRQLKLTNTTITPHHATDIPKGSFYYIDPVFLETGDITTHNDVFAFGIVLLQLVTSKEPKYIRNVVGNALGNRRLNHVVDALAKWPPKVAEKMARLGVHCCDPIRKNRPDLGKEVWTEIKSMEQGASCS